MGCVVSRIDKEERVVICKERKRVIKQLLRLRAEFSNAILAYLRALKNTGGTLRQFTESESLELDNVLPPSPPLPLPPSPPLPPPIDSPDLRKIKGKEHVREYQEEIIEIDEDNCCTQPPPPPESSWGISDLLDTSSLQRESEGVMVEDVEDDNWAETKSQFEEESQDHMITSKVPEAPKQESLNEDTSSMRGSRQPVEMVNTKMVVWRKKKTLATIGKELDDYFLRASTGAKEIAVMVDMGTRNGSLHHDIHETNGKASNSSRVLSSLSWNWSSKSSQLTQDETTLMEPCKAGAHCITLEKLYAEEQTLYKAVRDEELAKLEHKCKSLSLQKYEDENADLNKIHKTQSAVESLQSDTVRLQELEKRTRSSILTLIKEQLHPQLVSLLSGLIHMWNIMHECHQVQTRICQQVHHLISHDSTEPTTEFHREATVQLESEVKFWYNSFSRLSKSQRDYVNTLFRWVQLTDCLMDDENQIHHPSMVSTFCEKWLVALDRLPEKVVSEAIKSFLLVIHTIIVQQEEESILKKKSDRLERKLHKEINLLIEMEKKHEENVNLGVADSGLHRKHPLYIKRVKADTLRRRYESEKAKYMSSIQGSKAMTLKNLQTCLPHVFQALTGFSSACRDAFESILNQAQQDSDVEPSNAEC